MDKAKDQIYDNAIDFETEINKAYQEIDANKDGVID